MGVGKSVLHIFGTLLERALDKNERHKLGAHFTPRAYVERLVLPTIVEPLREQWVNVQAAAVTLAKGDDLAGRPVRSSPGSWKRSANRSSSTRHVGPQPSSTWRWST